MGLRLWQNSNKCRRCGLALRDDLSAEDRRDDLIKKSSLITNNYSAEFLCAPCRLIRSNNDFEITSFERQSYRNITRGRVFRHNNISMDSINHWVTHKGKKTFVWSLVIAFALLKISALINLFDDDQITEDILETPAISEQNIAAPTRILTGNRAIPFNLPEQWIGPNDYPIAALKEERQGVSHFALTVSKNGKVSTCQIIKTSGHDDLDTATCDAMMKRAIFYRGVDADNIAIESHYNSRVSWRLPE